MSLGIPLRRSWPTPSRTPGAKARISSTTVATRRSHTSAAAGLWTWCWARSEGGAGHGATHPIRAPAPRRQRRSRQARRVGRWHAASWTGAVRRSSPRRPCDRTGGSRNSPVLPGARPRRGAGTERGAATRTGGADRFCRKRFCHHLALPVRTGQSPTATRWATASVYGQVTLKRNEPGVTLTRSRSRSVYFSSWSAEGSRRSRT